MNEIKSSYIKKGGWLIIITTREKEFRFYYDEQRNTALGKMINEIMRISPIEINIHSWS